MCLKLVLKCYNRKKGYEKTEEKLTVLKQQFPNALKETNNLHNLQNQSPKGIVNRIT